MCWFVFIHLCVILALIFILKFVGFLELDHVRDVNWIPMDAVGPGSIQWGFDGFVAFPNRAVALEPTSKCDLPNPIAFLHPSFRFYVRQFVPERRRRCIAPPVETHS